MAAFSEETYHKIEAYLNSTMTEAEEASFEKEMNLNEELKAEVELLRRLDVTLKDTGRVHLQKTMNEVGAFFFQEETETPKTNSIPLKRIGTFSRQTWAIAAGFLVIVSAALLIWQLQSNSNTASGEELFAQYYETYDLNRNVRGDDDSSNVKKGIQQYQAKDFEAAVQVFLPLAAAEPQNDVAVFSLAHAYLNLTPPKLNLAKQQFERITTANATIYVPKAQWYLALIALKENNTERAKSLLKEVVDSGDDIAEEAEVLLKELE